ncbi:MAG: O-antigen ligase family protein [Clostridia bacterium]|nr:O-antigen ligase family protein [Clostridia bacterium]
MKNTIMRSLVLKKGKKIHSEISEKVWFVLLIFLFEPTIFVKIPKLNYLFIFGICVTFLYALYSFIIKNKKVSKLIVIMFFYRMSLLIPTIINDGDIIKWGYQSLNHITVFMMIELGFERNRDRTLKSLQNILITYLSINLVLYLKYPDGILNEFWGLHFLGIRTRFTDYLFLLIFISMIRWDMDKDKKFNIFCIIISLITMFKAWISTAIVGIIIVVLMYYFISKYFKKINPRIFLTLAFIIVVSITFFRVQNLFSIFIEEVLHKSVSLTGRTEIWDLSYDYIDDNLFFGHGYKNDGNFVYWRGEYWQGHNQFIQILYEGGIVNLIIFVILLYSAIPKIKEVNKEYRIMISFLFSYVVMMISEIYAYYPTLYAFLAIFYYYYKFEKEECKNE